MFSIFYSVYSFLYVFGNIQNYFYFHFFKSNTMYFGINMAVASIALLLMMQLPRESEIGYGHIQILEQSLLTHFDEGRDV